MAAVNANALSAVLGYTFIQKDFGTTTPNLPQRVAVLCEANEANQASLDTSEWQATSVAAVAERYGWGSPAYLIARILFPALNGIPLVYYPQAKASGAVACEWTITPSGLATDSATHTLIISGRDGIDGFFYNITIAAGDTSATINDKITNAITAVLGSPVSSTDTDYVATLKTKWNGLTSNDLKVRVDTNGKPAGITYTVAKTVSGAGTPSLGDLSAKFGNKWNTVVINSYGAVTSIMNALESYNGVPDVNNPTGQYTGIIMRPIVAYTGTVSEDPSSITDARSTQVTIAMCPAPNSEGFPFEAAANFAAYYVPIAENRPALDPIDGNLPDMPAPAPGSTIGAMLSYTERDRLVKKGCSTVDFVNGKYVIKDFVTTYHPEGQPAVFRFVRNLTVMFNIKFSIYLDYQSSVTGHVICNDADTVTREQKIVKPKMLKQKLFSRYSDLADRALIADVDFSKNSTSVNINGSNPDRLDVGFRTKLTGVARITATENEVGFNLPATA